MFKYKAQAVLLSRQNHECVNFLKGICNNYNINLIYNNDFFEFVTKVVNLIPELILIDGSTFNVKNFPFHLLDNLIFKEKAKIIILSDNFICNNSYIDIVSLNQIPAYIENFFKNKYFTPKINFRKDRSVQINNFLNKIGFKANHIGKIYLAESINLIINNRMLSTHLSNYCYPVIAEKNKTKAKNVEKDIRLAVKKAFLQRTPRVWEDAFNIIFTEIPSNKFFISLCVDKILEIENF